jgi:ribonuclease P protein component
VAKKIRYTLGSEERLKKRKQIEELFNSGESFSIFPFRVYYLLRRDPEVKDVLQFGAGVSKKNFKRAVDRNRIKRLLRESYRLQKNSLKEAVREREEWCLILFIVYTGKEFPDYSLVKEKVEQALTRVQKKLTAK